VNKLLFFFYVVGDSCNGNLILFLKILNRSTKN